MPRVLSANTLVALYRATAPHVRIEQRISVANYAGTLVDLSNYLGKDWCIEAHTVDGFDTPVTQGTFVLARTYADIATTLSPYVQASPANQVSGVGYRQLLKESRRITWDIRMVADGTTPLVGDWLPMFDGKIDEIDGKGRGNTITVTARDKFAWLLDTFIDQKRTYCATAPLEVRDVMAAILADNPQSKLGGVTLVDALPVGPTPPAFGLWMVRKFDQEQVPVLTALNDLAFQFGGVVRGMWQSDNTYQLTVFQPDRAKTAPDWTLSPDDYFDVPAFKVGDADVRNKGRVRFLNAATLLMDEVTGQDDPSVVDHGDRYVEFDEDSTSNIDSPSEATAFLGYALSDLGTPVADVEKETRFFPLATLYDLGAFPANGVHYDTSQTFGVVQVRHDVTRTARRTSIQVKGKVSGTVPDAAIKRPKPPQAPLINVISVAQVSATTGDATVSVTTYNGEAASVTLAAVPGSPQWTLVAASGDPTVRYVASGTTLGPTDWFSDGTSFSQALAGVPLAPVDPTTIYGQAQNSASRLQSPWTPIVFPGYETTGAQGGGATPTGVSVDMIIPVLLTDPAGSPSVIAAGQDDAFSQFSYNPAPFTKVRVDVDVIVAGTGDVRLQTFVTGTGWVDVAGAATPIDTAGFTRGTAVPNTIVTEEMFRVVPTGGASLKSVWVTFEPRALSIPPAPWVPTIPPLVCNSSLSGLQDWGEDWCAYNTDDDALTAYRWVDQGGWWSDYNEPVDDIEGMDVGLYDNIHVALAPDYKRFHFARGLPFNGGSTAVDFDSTIIAAEAGGTVFQCSIDNYRGMRNAVPTSIYPGGFTQPKVTLVARVWIDAASDLTPNGNFVEPCYVGWASFGAFGECFVCIQAVEPFTGIDHGSPRIMLVVYSYNTANAYVYDCGSAAALIGYDPGHEFKLEAQILPPTNSAYDKMQARLSIRRLPGGGAGGMEGQWIVRNQNLLNLSSGFWDQTNSWFVCRRNGTGYVHARCYSVEQWFGDKIWLGEPALVATSDVTPTPADDSTVATSLSVTDPFNPRPPGRPGLTSPTIALPSPWTRFNDAGFISALDKDGSGNALLNLAADGSGVPRGAVLTVPQLVSDHYYQLDATSIPATEANSGGFLYFSESATGKWVLVGIHHNGTNRRASVWKGTGALSAGAELVRGATNLTATAATLIIERSGGQWYFHYNVGGGLVTLTNVALSTVFTTGPDRVGFGAWSGASGELIALGALSFA
jgi:hypothetical protein